MGSKVKQVSDSWREQVRHLFFDCKKSIVEIEGIVGISRKSISGYLRQLPGYQRERERRKLENKERRPEYKRQWERKHRFTGGAVTAETIRREHETAVAILSREKYR